MPNMNQNQFNFELFFLLSNLLQHSWHHFQPFFHIFFLQSGICSLHTEDGAALESVINVIFVLNKDEIDSVSCEFAAG